MVVTASVAVTMAVAVAEVAGVAEAEAGFVIGTSVLRRSRECDCNAASSFEPSSADLVAAVVASTVVVVEVVVVVLLS